MVKLKHQVIKDLFLIDIRVRHSLSLRTSSWWCFSNPSSVWHSEFSYSATSLDSNCNCREFGAEANGLNDCNCIGVRLPRLTGWWLMEMLSSKLSPKVLVSILLSLSKFDRSKSLCEWSEMSLKSLSISSMYVFIKNVVVDVSCVLIRYNWYLNSSWNNSPLPSSSSYWFWMRQLGIRRPCWATKERECAAPPLRAS